MTEGLRSIVPLGRDSLRGVTPAPVEGDLPTFEVVDPRTIFVEDGYQRRITGNGIALVRKIVAAFSWARFKAPICVRLPQFDGALVCIDGQHTATAAASHPGLRKIPVMIVSAAQAELRASSFVGHNRDRIALTAPAIYHAELAAKEPMALLIDRACRAAGAAILEKSVNLRERQPVGSTIAIGTIRQIAKRQGEDALVRVLKLLVAAKRGPIKADEVAATALILAGSEQRDIDRRLRDVVASKTTEQWAAIGAQAAAENGDSLPGAVAAAWCRELGIRITLPTARAASTKSDASRFVKRIDAPRPAPSAPPPAPSPAKPAAPKAVARRVESESPKPAAHPKPIPSPAPPAKAEPAEGPLERNGVRLFPDGRLQHRGREVVLATRDRVEVVAALLRVMPAILGGDRVAAKAYPGRENGQDLVRHLVPELLPALEGARLTIRVVQKIGYTLFDLGP